MGRSLTLKWEPSAKRCPPPARLGKGLYCWRQPFGTPLGLGRENIAVTKLFLVFYLYFLPSLTTGDRARVRSMGVCVAFTYPRYHLLTQLPSSHRPLIPKSSDSGSGVLRRDSLLLSSSPGGKKKKDFLRETRIHRAVNTHCIPEEAEGGPCGQLLSAHALSPYRDPLTFPSRPGAENLPAPFLLPFPPPRHPFFSPF